MFLFDATYDCYILKTKTVSTTVLKIFPVGLIVLIVKDCVKIKQKIDNNTNNSH